MCWGNTFWRCWTQFAPTQFALCLNESIVTLRHLETVDATQVGPDFHYCIYNTHNMYWHMFVLQCVSEQWEKLTHTHTHTTVLLLFWNMSGTTRVRRYQKGKTRKVKTNLDLLEQEIASGSGICWAICNVSTSSQTTTPTSHHSVF